MSITLRRKMFKLGGETNTHGIGITSGLEYRRPGYNAGGKVDPRPYGYMQGPDGKMREAHNPFLAGLVGGGAGRAVLGSIARLLGSRTPGFISKRADPRGIMGFIKGTATTKRFTGLGGKPYDLITKAPSTTAGAKALRAAQLAATPAGLGLTGAGLISAAAPDIPEEIQEKIPLANLAQGARDVLLEPAADFNPLGALSYGLTGKSLTDLVEGDAEEVVGSDNDTDGGLNQKDISPAMETALTQEEQFAKMKADADARAEMYYAMLGGDGPNKVRALADAFTAAGALYDEDKSQALAGFSEGIQGELDRDEAVRDEARRLGLQEVVGLRDEERMDAKSRKQMVEQAKLAIMTSADMTPEQRQSTIRGLEAFELGVVDLLPTNDKGDEIDTGRMSPGSIYLDVNGITDGKYVAVSNDSNDPNQVDSFNNISEAEAHARS